MAAWFDFALYALQKIVTTVFQLDIGLGFTLGDFEVALLLIGLVGTALIVKTGSALSHELTGARDVSLRKETSSGRSSRVYGNFAD